MKPHHDLDDALLRRLYRELPDMTPHPDTDAELKAAARRATGAAPGEAPRRRGLAAHWRGITASAAALLLGVGLTLQWRTQEPTALEEAIAVASPPPVATAPAAAAEDLPAPAAAPAARAEAPPSAAPRALAAAPAPVAPPEPAVAAAPPPMPEPVAKAAPAAQAEAMIAAEAREARDAVTGTESVASSTRARRLGGQMAAPAFDYRLSLQSGRFAEALDRLLAPASAAETVDRELLRWQQGRHAPSCAGNLGAQALLCEGLKQRAAGQGPSAEWRARLEASGLVSGNYAYRRALVEAVFGAAE